MLLLLTVQKGTRILKRIPIGVRIKIAVNVACALGPETWRQSVYDHENEDWRERTRPHVPTRPVVPPLLDESLWPVFRSYLKKRRLSSDIAVSNGWYPTLTSDGVPRIVITTSSLQNSWFYYQARAMTDGKGVTRYVSPSAPRGDALAVVFPSGDALGSIIVEGPMDALAAAELGLVGVSVMGNTPNSLVLDHIESIVKVYGQCFVIPDRDAFTEGASITADLWARGVRCTLRSIQGAKDLAELSPERRKILIS